MGGAAHADAPILRLDSDALAYVFVLVAEAKSVLMTRMGKATSPKKAFLAKLEFSEVCSRFKQVASSAHFTQAERTPDCTSSLIVGVDCARASACESE